MAIKKGILVRDWHLFNDTANNPAAPTWVEVKGRTLMRLGFSAKEIDTTTQDDGGHETHVISRRGKSVAWEGQYMIDPTAGTRDPGQAAVEALGNQIGDASIGHFQIKGPNNAVIKTFLASVQLGDQLGNDDEAAAFAFNLKFSGDFLS